MLVTDGGLDHNLTHVQVILPYICLALKVDVDFLFAVRTAPQISWRNPTEQAVSSINLALQSVATDRRRMDSKCEEWVKGCNSMDAVCKAIAEHPEHKGGRTAWLVSLHC